MTRSAGPEPARSAYGILRALATLLLAPLPAAGQLPASLSDTSFAQLSARLSEPSGFFDTDNLISNEDSYLHAVSTLQQLGIHGGTYLGVGPDQNFSYIAAVRPEIAFIVDIRRDNLLEQLLYQAIFRLSHDRLEFLCLLFGKAAPTPPPDHPEAWANKDVAQLLDYIDRSAWDSSAALSRVSGQVGKLGMQLSAADRTTIAGFHRTFITRGPALRMTTFNRPERLDYPDYRKLILETDLAGHRANYLASESGFAAIKDLEDRNLVVPVVGNFAGPKALALIGEYVRAHRSVVSVFYTSNVEQYLVQQGTMSRFRRNVERLPRGPRSVMVRSYFPYGRGHPQLVAGYLTVQLVQEVDKFLATGADSAEYQSYYDLVTRDLVQPATVKER